MSFEGKTVWITGASSGIGEALAHAFDRRGARLILSARNEKKLQTVRAACGAAGDHLIEPLDLSRPETIGEKAARVLARVGQVDVLVNNGGVSQRSLVMDTSPEIERRIMEINFFGTVALRKCVLPAMLERKSGHIVVISSVVGKFGTPLRSTYAASKHALHGFMDALRAETWCDGLKITLICPGFIRTGISLNALTGDGTPHGSMDDGVLKGMAPDRCAEKILRALEKGKEEVIVGGWETLGVYLKRFLPGVFNAVIRRARVT